MKFILRFNYSLVSLYHSRDPNDNEIEQFLWPKYNTIRQDCLKIYLKSFEIENCSITSNECKVWDAYQ